MRQIVAQNVNALDLRVADGYGALWVVGTPTSLPQASVVLRIDDTTGLPLSQTPVGRHGGYLFTATIAVGAGGVWVAELGDDAVFRLDPMTGRVVAVIPTQRPPWAITTAFGHVWVSVR